MPATIASLQRHPVWRHFLDLCAIPRPSGGEERAREFALAWAATNGFETKSDKAGNISIRVPASPGHERSPRVTLQAHLDMVCVKEPSSRHDFAKDPIKPRIVGEWLWATGTTLGADNGIGVAMAMAAAESRTITHGPLEVLLTTDEERGLVGASALDPKIVAGELLINLDSEEEHLLYVGCAGGRTMKLVREVRWSKPPAGWKAFGLRIDKLAGGHSGAEIHLHLANANRWMARLLAHLASSGVTFRLGALNGGTARNVIPSVSDAVVWITPAQAPRLRAAVETFRAVFKDERVGRDAPGRIAVEALRAPDRRALTPVDQQAFQGLLLDVPAGVVEMSRSIAHLVETSSTPALVESGDAELSIVQSTRSSSGPSLEAWTRRITALAESRGFRVAEANGYPPWPPAPDAPLVGAYREAYRRTLKGEPHVTAIHAGLECGVICSLKPGVQAISVGPDILSPHSTRERVRVESVDRVWRVLGTLLEQLA